VPVAAIASLSIANAHEVSTEVQKKNALLEEFTGIHCVFCPDGHKIANNLITAQEGKIYTIAVHSGNYAQPYTGEPDFRIPEGEAIDNYFQVSSYPCGTVNRKQIRINGQLRSLILGRSEWSKSAKEVIREDAPVNLWMNAAFDGSSRTLTVDVEAYYTSDSETEENFMNLLITQSNILGPQTGGLMGDEYVHRHQLKAFITPLWGDTIHQPKAGEYFTKRYVYQLPEAVNNVPLKAEDMEILAFVTAGKTDVLNVIGQKPSYINYTKPMKITLSPPKEGYAACYAFNFFELNVKNESHYSLTTIDFTVNINNEAQTVTWTGEIPSYQSQTLRLNVQPYNLLENNTFEIEATKVNDKSVSNTRLSGTFEQPFQTTPRLLVNIKTDVYADENTFTLKNREGQIVHTFGPYPAGENTLRKDTVDLEANQIYCFEVADCLGDGFSSGYVELKKSDASTFAQNRNISTFGSRLFFVTALPNVTAVHSPQPLDLKASVDERNNLCLSGDLSGQIAMKLYALSGQCVWKREIASKRSPGDVRIPLGGLSSGLYLLEINKNNQRETSKIQIR
jgi:hypothetical protein